jgi:hypothetical protein
MAQNDGKKQVFETAISRGKGWVLPLPFLNFALKGLIGGWYIIISVK